MAFNWKAFHKTIYANGEGSNSLLSKFRRRALAEEVCWEELKKEQYAEQNESR
jgi:hypothetical protein